MRGFSSLSGDRIEAVDVLRAVALFGICVTHATQGFLAGPTGPDFMIFGPADRVAAQLSNLLFFGKFYTIFSFLFGLSFAIQLQNAARKGAGFAGRFAWRLVVLAMIAVIHGAFFTGDILIVYAALGLLLIPMRGLNTTTLLLIAAPLMLDLPSVWRNVQQVSTPPTAEQIAQAEAGFAAFMQAAQRGIELKQSAALPALVQFNLTEGLIGKLAFMTVSGRIWITFGLFLLGMAAGRAEIFKDTEANRRFFGRLLAFGGVVAALTTALELLHPAGFDIRSWADVASAFSFTIQQLSLSTFYVAAVTLLYWRRPAGALAVLAPAGRMGLTVYLTQTVFGVGLFYGVGLGLLGRIGVAPATAAAAAFFVVQVFVAHRWMKRFTMGPAEWLWRSLTYLSPQPLVRAKAAAQT